MGLSVTAIALLAILIPSKISSQTSYSSQTTETTTLPSKPLLWADLRDTSDYRGWIPRTKQLKLALGSFVSKYGGNYFELYDTVVCESNWNENAKNPKSTASGISQFLDSTFKQYCEGDKKNPFDQLECMVKMFSEGKSFHWECWHKIMTT